MDQTQFFSDLKVVELSSVLAGPAAGMFFAELGAQVIKIENKRTNGDVTRSWKLSKENPDSPASAYYHSVNWGKKSILMDLADPVDKETVLQYLNDCDIVITNFKAGSDQKLGYDYEAIKSINPNIIYAAINAYGEGNPKPGFDVLLQAETGWMSMNGQTDGPPTKMPVAMMDLLAAHQLKEGVLMALLKRNQTGQGSHVTVSLFDSGVSSLANQASNYLNQQHVPQRMGSCHPNIAPYGDIFKTADGKDVVTGIGTQQQFEALCHILSVPHLIGVKDFSNNAHRVKNRSTLISKLAEAFSLIPYDLLISKCEESQVPVAPIHDMRQLFETPMADNLVLHQTEADGTISKRVKSAIFKIS